MKNVILSELLRYLPSVLSVDELVKPVDVKSACWHMVEIFWFKSQHAINQEDYLNICCLVEDVAWGNAASATADAIYPMVSLCCTK